MQAIATLDTREQQAFARPILVGNMPTFGASLRGVVGVNTHHHTTRKNGFIRKHGVQLSKRPLRIHAVALASFARNALGSFSVLLLAVGASFGSFSNMGQLFYPNQGMWILLNNAFGDRVFESRRSEKCTIDNNGIPCLARQSFFPPRPLKRRGFQKGTFYEICGVLLWCRGACPPHMQFPHIWQCYDVGEPFIIPCPPYYTTYDANYISSPT